MSNLSNQLLKLQMSMGQDSNTVLGDAHGSQGISCKKKKKKKATTKKERTKLGKTQRKEGEGQQKGGKKREGGGGKEEDKEETDLAVSQETGVIAL